MKIVLFDIETRPLLGYAWGVYEQNILTPVQDWSLLSFSMKELGSKKVYTYALPDFPSYRRNKNSDKELTKKLWEMMNKADLIIAHNGDSFDIKKSNTRFLVHGLEPPAPYKTVDTLKVLRRVARFDSNKLDEVARQLGVGRKIKTGGFDLWKGCMEGDMGAWRKMKKYNAQDVLLLEKVYLKIRGWDARHPAVNLHKVAPLQCPTCGSDKTQKSGTSYTRAFKKQRHHCLNCGHWFLGEQTKK